MRYHDSIVKPIEAKPSTAWMAEISTRTNKHSPDKYVTRRVLCIAHYASTIEEVMNFFTVRFPTAKIEVFRIDNGTFVIDEESDFKMKNQWYSGDARKINEKLELVID